MLRKFALLPILALLMIVLVLGLSLPSINAQSETATSSCTPTTLTSAFTTTEIFPNPITQTETVTNAVGGLETITVTTTITESIPLTTTLSITTSECSTPTGSVGVPQFGSPLLFLFFIGTMFVAMFVAMRYARPQIIRAVFAKRARHD